MLKGHVFKEQIFGNQVFAYFIDTFLNKKCGIGDYKNKMEVTFSGTDVTVQSGLACVRGRFIEEDTFTTINAGTESYFCKLIIEIDLDKENTEESLNQAYYKIVKDTTNYPSLTQTDIVANDSGVYQYELARFKTSTSGISDFQDMRTYVDFDSIYAEIESEYRSILQVLQQELASVEDGSDYILKSNFATFDGDITAESGASGYAYFNFPSGFTAENSMIVSFCCKEKKDKSGNYVFGAYEGEGEAWKQSIYFNSNTSNYRIGIRIISNASYTITVHYKVILMRI